MKRDECCNLKLMHRVGQGVPLFSYGALFGQLYSAIYLKFALFYLVFRRLATVLTQVVYEYFVILDKHARNLLKAPELLRL